MFPVSTPNQYSPAFSLIGAGKRKWRHPAASLLEKVTLAVVPSSAPGLPLLSA
jgi:hypothetical protein